MSTALADSGNPGAPWRVVARREFRERLRERSFAISTLITILIVAAFVLVPKLVSGSATSVAFSGQHSKYVSAQVRAAASAADVKVQVVTTPADPESAVRDGRIDVLVLDDRVIVNRDLDAAVAGLIQTAHRDVSQRRALASSGLTAAQTEAVLAVAPLALAPLTAPDPQASQREALAVVIAFLLYGQILGYGIWVASGVVEEKASRVVEVLLAMVRPQALLTGKVLGIGILGLMQLLIVGAVGLTLGVGVGSVTWGNDLIVSLAAAVGWFVLGFAFYAAGYALGASRVSRQEDLQNVVIPINLLAIGSFLAAVFAADSPDSTLLRVLAVLPPFSALMQPPRIAAGYASIGEIGIAVVLMIAATAGLIALAARVYQNSVLRIGAPVSLREAWRR